MSKTAVIILNWNGRKFLEEFLPFVVQFNSANAEIIVADNASTDDSVEWLKINFPAIRIIRNQKNGGFAKGYNESLTQVDADYYVLLNSDVEVTAGWLEPIIKMLDADNSIAAVQPKICDYKDKTKFEYAGAAGGFIDKYGYPFCRGRIFETLETDSGQFDNDLEIFWATGACMFVRSSVWKELGGLDEDFFAHMEEIDLCWRMRNCGYKIMYSGKSEVYHVGGGTLSKQNSKKTFLNFRNNLILILKNHNSEYLFFKIVWRLFLDGIAGTKFFFTGEFAHTFAVLRAHYAFYSVVGTTLKKRNVLKSGITKFATKGIYTKSIVADYFLRGKKKFNDLKQEDFHS
ncbi:glycosyltransferase family 2 protein [soil metagenome]